MPPGDPAEGRRDRPRPSLRPRIHAMKFDWSRDTDAALLEGSREAAEETREISVNPCIDLDSRGDPVARTPEHARPTAALPRMGVELFGKGWERQRHGATKC